MKTKKKKKFQVGGNVDNFGRSKDFDWKTSDDVELNIYEKGMRKTINQGKALNNFIVNKSDIDKYNTPTEDKAYSLDDAHPLLNMTSGERRTILNAFKDDPELQSIDAGYLNAGKVPLMTHKDSRSGLENLGDREQFSIFSKGYYKKPKGENNDIVSPYSGSSTPTIDSQPTVEPSPYKEPYAPIQQPTKGANKAIYYKNADGSASVKTAPIDKRLMASGYIPTGKNGAKLQRGGLVNSTEYLKQIKQHDDSIYQGLSPRSLDPIDPKGHGAIYNRLKEEGRKKLRPIEDNRGQWAHPGKVTKINSNKITMQDVNYPVLGVSDTGHQQLMQPEGEYTFNGNNVTEYPMAKSGIHIKPENKGKFNATKKATGKTTEELTHSKNPVTKKRAIFAQNAKKWKHQEGGIVNNLGGASGILDSASGLVQGFQMLGQEKKQKQQANQFMQVSDIVQQASALPVDHPERKYVRPEDALVDPNQMLPSYGVGTNYLKNGGKVKKAQNGADAFGQYTNGYPSSGGMGQTGQFLSGIGNRRASNLGEMAGSLIGGGKGMPNGGGKIGSSIGGVAGGLIGGPIGGAIGSFAGGIIGGWVGGKNQKDTTKYQNQGYANLNKAALNESVQNVHSQYEGFMRNGGKMQMGGELTTQWGGNAESVSQNPYLPDGGETVEFRGNSHSESDGNGNTGIGIKFGNTPVEVEGGEPAVKLQNGGNATNLTVFGDMKIPSYGVSELGDKTAKNKKFKNYVNELNEKEKKQNKTVQNSLEIINNEEMLTPYDQLKFSSANAMMKGANMRLQDIATRKQIASHVQSAILDTATEMNLKPEELAKGKFKKAKQGAKIAQFGGGFRGGDSVERGKVKDYLEQNPGWELDPENANRLRRQYSVSTGGGYKAPKNVNPQFEKKFATSRANKEKTFEYNGKQYTTDLAIEGGATSKGYDYKPIYDPNGDKWKNPMDIKKPEFSYKAPYEQPTTPEEETYKNQGMDWMDVVNTALPFLRPSNKLNLDPNQLSGEMLALASNQLDPVQAQLYHPLLEQATDISLQDQMNANQSDFNAISRQTEYNSAAQSVLAGQKYAANSGVLGEQFRQNQTNKQGVYNRNRGVLNDATLKNLAILDQQYVRQSQAKSNTKAVAQQAINSISDKIAKNKLENKTLGIYENLYNYRFGPNGHAWNMNDLARFNTQGDNLPTVDNNGVETTRENTQDRDRMGNIKNSRTRVKTKEKHKNGGLVRFTKDL